MRTDSIPAAQPKPTTAQTSRNRPAVCAARLAKSNGSTVALADLDLHVAAGEISWTLLAPKN